jgi:hypothetical protein
MESLTHDGMFCISMFCISIANSSPFPNLGVPSLYLPLGTVTEWKFVNGKWCLSAATCLSWSTRMMLYVALTVLMVPSVSLIVSPFPPTVTTPLGSLGATLFWSSNESVAGSTRVFRVGFGCDSCYSWWLCW